MTATFDLLRATRAELFKLRRTLALWAALLCPLVVIVMTTAILLSGPPGQVAGPNQVWDSLAVNFVFFLWCLLGLPLFVALETTLLAGLEHRENSWKHLCALPIGRWSIYVAKLLVASALVVLSTVVLAVGVGIEGVFLIAVRPDLGLTLPIPWSTILGRSVTFTAAALLLVAIQSWVAIRWRSFTIALGLGIVGTVAGLVLSISPRAASFASLFPWSIPLIAVPRTAAGVSPLIPPQIQLTAFLVGVVAGLVVAMLGCWETSRGDVQ